MPFSLEVAEAIVEIGRLMYQKGWVAANDGNISVRLGPDRMLCTPTGVSKGRMKAADMVVADFEGKKVDGNTNCTSEILMHATVYKTRPEVNAVVHAHPPISTGFAVAGRPLNLAILPEAVVALGTVPLADYGLPGTPELSNQLAPFIPNHDALLMANHGVVCYADSLEKAFFRLETVEHLARIALVAELLGGPQVLPRHEVSKLVAARERYGIRFASGCEPEMPLAAEDLVPRRGENRIEIGKAELVAMLDDLLKAKGLV
ncbi:MAG: class II aldolase/adducin family protein [Bryobacter sp.]